MFEALLVAGILLFFVALVLLNALISATTLTIGGISLIGVGLLLGVGGGLGYHYWLYRGLVAAGPLPKRWWLYPTEQHERLSRAAWHKALPWFVAGAAGFGLIMLGAVVTFLTAIREL